MTRLLWSDVRTVFRGASALGNAIVTWYNSNTTDANEVAELDDVMVLTHFLNLLDVMKKPWNINVRVFDKKRLEKAKKFLNNRGLNRSRVAFHEFTTI